MSVEELHRVQLVNISRRRHFQTIISTLHPTSHQGYMATISVIVMSTDAAVFLLFVSIGTTCVISKREWNLHDGAEAVFTKPRASQTSKTPIAYFVQEVDAIKMGSPIGELPDSGRAKLPGQ